MNNGKSALPLPPLEKNLATHLGCEEHSHSDDVRSTLAFSAMWGALSIFWGCGNALAFRVCEEHFHFSVMRESLPLKGCKEHSCFPVILWGLLLSGDVGNILDFRECGEHSRFPGMWGALTFRWCENTFVFRGGKAHFSIPVMWLSLSLSGSVRSTLYFRLCEALSFRSVRKTFAFWDVKSSLAFQGNEQHSRCPVI